MTSIVYEPFGILYGISHSSCADRGPSPVRTHVALGNTDTTFLLSASAMDTAAEFNDAIPLNRTTYIDHGYISLEEERSYSENTNLDIGCQ